MAACGLVVLTAACGSSGEPSETPVPTSSSERTAAPPGEPVEETVVTISDFAFDVPESVPPGAEITVVNEDGSFHTVTADDGTFDVDVPGGETVTFTAPADAGEFAFHCTPHPQMTATLVVG